MVLAASSSRDYLWLLVAAFLFGLLGGWVADRRHRPYWQGFLLGFFFGGFGVVAALLFLRDRSAAPPRGPHLANRENELPPEQPLPEGEGDEGPRGPDEHPVSPRCPSCDTALGLNDRFCPSCGRKVE